MAKERGIYQVSLKLLLKNNKGEILALKAADNGSYAGYHDLPGGRIDADEFNTDFTEIIEREVKEEIGDIKISDEHSNFKWLNLKDIKLEEYFTSGILEGVKMYCDGE